MESLRQEPLGTGIVNSTLNHEESTQILDIRDAKRLNKCTLRRLKDTLGTETQNLCGGGEAVKRGRRCDGPRLVGVSLVAVSPPDPLTDGWIHVAYLCQNYVALICNLHQIISQKNLNSTVIVKIRPLVHVLVLLRNTSWREWNTSHLRPSPSNHEINGKKTSRVPPPGRQGKRAAVTRLWGRLSGIDPCGGGGRGRWRGERKRRITDEGGGGG